LGGEGKKEFPCQFVLASTRRREEKKRAGRPNKKKRKKKDLRNNFRRHTSEVGEGGSSWLTAPSSGEEKEKKGGRVVSYGVTDHFSRAEPPKGKKGKGQFTPTPVNWRFVGPKELE